MTITGPDVSNNNGAVDWHGVVAAGHRFGFAKASEGLDYTDPDFERNWKEMARAGIIRGAYHFARPQPGRTGAQEAHHFLRVVHAAGGMRDRGDLPLVLDIEWSEGLGTDALSLFIHDFCRVIRRHTGRTPIIYTGSWWREHNPRRPYRAPLWLAAYVGDPNPYIPSAWRRLRFWQYTSTAQVRGILGNADLSRFYGGHRRLRSFSKIGPAGRARRRFWRRRRHGSG